MIKKRSGLRRLGLDFPSQAIIKVSACSTYFLAFDFSTLVGIHVVISLNLPIVPKLGSTFVH